MNIRQIINHFDSILSPDNKENHIQYSETMLIQFQKTNAALKQYLAMYPNNPPVIPLIKIFNAFYHNTNNIIKGRRPKTMTPEEEGSLQLFNSLIGRTVKELGHIKLFHTSFDMKQGMVNTGGKQGSVRVQDFSQKSSQAKFLKPGSVLKDPYRENLADYLYLKIAHHMSPTAIPKGNIYWDSLQSRAVMTSEYIEGKCQNLSELYGKLAPKKVVRHPVIGKLTEVKEVSDAKDSTPYKVDPKGILFLNQKLIGDLHQGLAINALLQNHDINPGNFLLAENKGQFSVAAIDGGKAFGGLTSAPSGGGVDVLTWMTKSKIRRDKNSLILDYFNRLKIASLKEKQSKLHKYYHNIIPSYELVMALENLAKSTQQLQLGIQEAKQELTAFIVSVNKICPDEAINIANGLETINRQLGIDDEINPKKFYSSFFKNLSTFLNNNLRDMARVAQLMKIQLVVDDLIQGKKIPKGLLSEEDCQKIVALLAEEKTATKFIKMDMETNKPAFSGTFAKYCKTRITHYKSKDYNFSKLVHDLGIEASRAIKRPPPIAIPAILVPSDESLQSPELWDVKPGSESPRRKNIESLWDDDAKPERVTSPKEAKSPRSNESLRSFELSESAESPQQSETPRGFESPPSAASPQSESRGFESSQSESPREDKSQRDFESPQSVASPKEDEPQQGLSQDAEPSIGRESARPRR
jgi:hypothetical protein